jgi:hypothetical protein
MNAPQKRAVILENKHTCTPQLYPYLHLQVWRCSADLDKLASSPKPKLNEQPSVVIAPHRWYELVSSKIASPHYYA